MMKEIQQTQGQTRTKSTSYIIKTLFAGGIAGCAAKTAIAPLDRVKILFQASNPSVAKYAGSASGVFRAMGDIYSRNGILGLFQGNTATIVRIFPYAAIKFMAYEQFKTILVPKNQSGKGHMEFVAGSLAGITSVFFTYPMDMLRTRMAYEVENPVGLIKACKNIYQEPPASKLIPLRISNFYRGFVPTILGMVPYAGMSFWTHSKLVYYMKTQLTETATYRSNDGKIRLKSWAELLSGGLAGAIAQTLSYPLEVIRRKMQVSGRNPSQNMFNSIRSTATHIVRTKGFKGFFVGLSIGYIKVTPMVAISFFTYDKMKQILEID